MSFDAQMEEQYDQWAAQLEACLAAISKDSPKATVEAYIVLNRSIVPRDEEFRLPLACIAETFNALASAASCLGLFSRAETLSQMAVRTMGYAVGDYDVNTERLRFNLATLYREHNKFEKAEYCFYQTSAIMLRFRHDHQFNKEQFRLFCQMLRASKKIVDAKRLIKVAHRLDHQGKWNEAENVLYKARDILQPAFPQDSPEFIPVFSALSRHYKKRARFDQAKMFADGVDLIKHRQEAKLEKAAKYEKLLPPIPKF